MCYSCKESNNYAQGHPASKKNPWGTCLNFFFLETVFDLRFFFFLFCFLQMYIKCDVSLFYKGFVNCRVVDSKLVVHILYDIPLILRFFRKFVSAASLLLWPCPLKSLHALAPFSPFFGIFQCNSIVNKLSTTSMVLLS